MWIHVCICVSVSVLKNVWSLGWENLPRFSNGTFILHDTEKCTLTSIASVSMFTWNNNICPLLLRFFELNKMLIIIIKHFVNFKTLYKCLVLTAFSFHSIKSQNPCLSDPGFSVMFSWLRNSIVCVLFCTWWLYWIWLNLFPWSPRKYTLLWLLSAFEFWPNQIFYHFLEDFSVFNPDFSSEFLI